MYPPQSEYSQLHGVSWFCCIKCYIYRGQWKYRLAHSTHFPELHSAPVCPIGWLGGWAAPPDCLTWLQMVLKSWPGAQPEGPGPLRLQRNCAMCSAHCWITLFNLDISYHHDEALTVMFFFGGYGSETAEPRRGGLTCHAALIEPHPQTSTFFFFLFVSHLRPLLCSCLNIADCSHSCRVAWVVIIM